MNTTAIVDQILSHERDVISFAKHHNINLLIGWYVWSLISYLFVRELKSFPMRMIIHRLFVIASFVSASLFSFVVFVKGKYNFIII